MKTRVAFPCRSVTTSSRPQRSLGSPHSCPAPLAGAGGEAEPGQPRGAPAGLVELEATAADGTSDLPGL